MKFPRNLYTGRSALITLALLFVLPNPGWAGTEKVLHNFGAANDGSGPAAGMTFDRAGNLYGTTTYGGSAYLGTIFKLVPNSDGSWTEGAIFSFSVGSGGYPSDPILFDPQGHIISSTPCGQDCGGGGYIFELLPGVREVQRYLTLYYMNLSGRQGSCTCGLALVGDYIYATAFAGGPQGSAGPGLVLRIDRVSSQAITLHVFQGPDGQNPANAVILDAAGNLYGTTENGGAYGRGTVFEVSPAGDGSWTEKLLHSFQGGSDGAYPASGVIFDTSGNLVGTTTAGGRSNNGTVFKLTHNGDDSWTKSTLYTFQDAVDGSNPNAVTFDQAWNLYGSTSQGGSHLAGTVFKLTPTTSGPWRKTTLYNFFGGDDGDRPVGAVTFDQEGNVYGVTAAGGIYNAYGIGGVAYEVIP